jgi:signal transduction histidine kinase/ActR/RegA family two-component response regulator
MTASPLPPDLAPRGAEGQWALLVGLLSVVAMLAALSIASILTLSAVRAYVGGESLYAKGQKEAVRALDRYTNTLDEAAFQRFEAALAIPLGDREARLALDEEELNEGRATAGFLQGGNHADDIPGMIRLYRWFRHVDFMSDAIGIWALADAEILQLRLLGHSARALAQQPGASAAQLAELQPRIDALNIRLDRLEQRFSERFGVASREVCRLLVITTLLLAATLSAAAALFVKRTLNRLAASTTELRRSNLRWGLAASAAGLGIFEWDVTRDEFLLDAHSRGLHGWSGDSATVSAVELRGCIHADDRQRVATSLRQAASSFGTWLQRYRIQRADGQTRHLEVSALVVPLRGRPDRMVGVIRDTTEQMQADELRMAKLAAEQASLTKSEMLSRVSHELRTPLNAILGFAQLMAIDKAEPLGAAQQGRLQHVLGGGAHLLQLVNDVLQLSAVEHGSTSIRLEPLDIDEIIEETASLMAPVADAKGVELRHRRSPAAIAVRTDGMRVVQVLMNLVSNAIKYNHRSGHVDIEVCSDGRRACIVVTDTGIGMTPEQLQHLFEPFNRLGAERAGTEGVGLGLVLCRTLAQRLGGSLELDSQHGRGTTARLYLPCMTDDVAAEPAVGADLAGRAAPTPQRDATPTAPMGSAGLVLYVEDDPINVLLVEQMIARFPGVEMLVAIDGQSGIALARQSPPDLILLDMHLPDMHGLLVLDALRGHPLTREVPVVMLSASAMPDQIAQARARGAAGYITKPLDFGLFEAELRARLATKPRPPPRQPAGAPVAAHAEPIDADQAS